jgi:hypothetical protein
MGVQSWMVAARRCVFSHGTITPGHDSIAAIREIAVEESQGSSQGLCHSGRTSESTFRTVTIESNAGRRFGVDVGKANTYH